MIDASSSGSRITVFRWSAPSGGGLPWVRAAPFPRRSDEPPWTESVRGGLAQYAGDPAGAGPSLAPLIDFAVGRLDPEGVDLAATRLYLKATAGLRLVAEPARERILESARAYLRAGPFDFRGAEVISGTEEGLYGWIAINYLLGHLGRGGPFPTVGALDLGGASTQITYVPLDHPEDEAVRLEIAGTTYEIYTHSYLGFGQDKAQAAVASADCYPRGYPLPAEVRAVGTGAGSGNYAACREAIGRFLSRSCAAATCSLMGVYQPPLYGEFFAVSGYVYAAAFFGLGQDLSLAELESRGRDYCAEDWREIEREHPDPSEREYLPGYCFKAAYIVTLLSDGFGFPMTTRRIATARRVQGSPAGWVLGSLVYELGGGAKSNPGGRDGAR